MHDLGKRQLAHLDQEVNMVIHQTEGMNAMPVSAYALGNKTKEVLSFLIIVKDTLTISSRAA